MSKPNGHGEAFVDEKKQPLQECVLRPFMCFGCCKVARDAMLHVCRERQVKVFCEKCIPKKCASCESDNAMVGKDERNQILAFHCFCDECGEVIVLNEKEHHIYETCRNRTLQCNPCGQLFRGQVKLAEHCCTVSCFCGENIQESDMSDHISRNKRCLQKWVAHWAIQSERQLRKTNDITSQLSTMEERLDRVATRTHIASTALEEAEKQKLKLQKEINVLVQNKEMQDTQDMQYQSVNMQVQANCSELMMRFVDMQQRFLQMQVDMQSMMQKAIRDQPENQNPLEQDESSLHIHFLPLCPSS